MQNKIEIRSYFTPWHEATKEQAAQLVRIHLHGMDGILETRRPARIESEYLRGATCADVLPELTAKNAAPGEYFAAFGSVVRVSRIYTLTEAEANASSLLYLERVELYDLRGGEYIDTVLPGSRTVSTSQNWAIYREEAAAL